MRLDMRTRKVITKEVARRYRKAGKKGKRVILDEFTATTGYNRSYAARILRKEASSRRRGKSIRGRPKIIRKADGRGRKPKYGNEVKKALTKIWAILDCPCGKRLVANLTELVNVLKKFREIELSNGVREKLISISSATADRLLRDSREKMKLKSRSKTRPGSLLKHQVPVRTFAQWDDLKPGFLEMDLVGHDGGNTRGDFCQSLDAVDVATGWSEIRAVKNKAQRWVFAAIQDIRESLPFPLLGLDSDNGAEFINGHLIRYCQQERITFTRSREYRKNDNCYVEQKNYTAVRRSVGYMRHDTEEELLILNQLYSILCLYLNLFQPQMKLIEKERCGSKVKKKYDKPQTPYQRVLASPLVNEKVKRELNSKYAKLNPAELKRRILGLQARLYEEAI